MPKIKINGLDFYYEIQGRGFPVIFVNGIFSTTVGWMEQVKALKDDFQTITYDCRNQGQTDFPDQDYVFMDHILDLKGLMENLNISKAHIVAISHGATIATQFASLFPDKVEKLVLMSSFTEPNSKTLSVLYFMDHYLKNNSLRSFYHTLMLLGLGESFYNRLAPMLSKMSLDFEKRFGNDKEKIFRLFRAAANGQIADWNKLEKIKANTLIIAGKQDFYVSPVCSYLMQKHIEKSEVLIYENCGHSVYLEKPEELNRDLIRFFKG